jgi:hypothetical protein
LSTRHTHRRFLYFSCALKNKLQQYACAAAIGYIRRREGGSQNPLCNSCQFAAGCERLRAACVTTRQITCSIAQLTLSAQMTYRLYIIMYRLLSLKQTSGRRRICVGYNVGYSATNRRITYKGQGLLPLSHIIYYTLIITCLAHNTLQIFYAHCNYRFIVSRWI